MFSRHTKCQLLLSFFPLFSILILQIRKYNGSIISYTDFSSHEVYELVRIYICDYDYLREHHSIKCSSIVRNIIILNPFLQKRLSRIFYFYHLKRINKPINLLYVEIGKILRSSFEMATQKKLFAISIAIQLLGRHLKQRFYFSSFLTISLLAVQFQRIDRKKKVESPLQITTGLDRHLINSFQAAISNDHQDIFRIFIEKGVSEFIFFRMINLKKIRRLRHGYLTV